MLYIVLLLCLIIVFPTIFVVYTTLAINAYINNRKDEMYEYAVVALVFLFFVIAEIVIFTYH